MKSCRRCKLDKPLTDFSKRADGHGVTGALKSYCKVCMCELVCEWQRRNKAHRAQYLREYRAL